MKKIEMSSIEQLISESEKPNAFTEEKLMNDFMRCEYEWASWDVATMGDKEQLRNEMFQNIKAKNSKEQ